MLFVTYAILHLFLFFVTYFKTDNGLIGSNIIYFMI